MAGQTTNPQTKSVCVDEADHEKKVSELKQLPLQFELPRFAPFTHFQSVVTCTPHEIRDLFLSGLTVPVNRILLTVAGLPGCGKSESLMTMLSQVVTTTREASMAPLSFLHAGNGMPYCELAATVLPNKELMYLEATKKTCYLYAMEYSINEHYHHHSQRIEKFGNSGLKVKSFNDNDLDSHFDRIFQHLSHNHKMISSTPQSPTEWQKTIPNGLVEINIWDIKMSKSIYYFLPALWGHLDRNYLWLFLDLESKLNQLPSVPEKECFKNRNDQELIMRYNNNLYYFLRYTMLVKSLKGDRENVCSLFAMNELGNLDGISNVEDDIKDAAIKMGVKKCIREHITALQRDDDDVKILKKELDTLVNQSLKSSKQIPLSFVFLCSLFYENKRIYITKDELQSKGHDLGMSNNDLNDFCKFFMSSGSVIDVSQISLSSPYVIVKPMKFTQELDKIFYPQSDIYSDSQITEYGLVTEEKAKAIFNHEYQFFMDVLVSVDLAIQLTGNQIDFEGSPLPCNQSYYYMPDVRAIPPDLTCDPSALNLLLDIDCPLSHLQVVFTKSYFANEQSSVLVLKRNTPINITNFRTTSFNKSEVDFQLRYLGNAIEIRLSNTDPLADDTTCGDIVHACNEMMMTDRWLRTKYTFAVMCTGQKDTNHLHYKHHILPFNGQCERCKQNDRSNELLELWNKATRENKISNWRLLPEVTSIRLSSSSENLAFKETLQKILVDTIEPKENVLESQENQKKVEVQEANGRLLRRLKTEQLKFNYEAYKRDLC